MSRMCSKISSASIGSRSSSNAGQVASRFCHEHKKDSHSKHLPLPSSSAPSDSRHTLRQGWTLCVEPKTCDTQYTDLRSSGCATFVNNRVWVNKLGHHGRQRPRHELGITFALSCTPVFGTPRPSGLAERAQRETHGRSGWFGVNHLQPSQTQEASSKSSTYYCSVLIKSCLTDATAGGNTVVVEDSALPRDCR